MFGLGMMEILMILAIALIVVGPQKLPELARTLGKAMGEFKRSAQDLKRSMDVETTVKEIVDIPKTDLNEILSDSKKESEENKPEDDPQDDSQTDQESAAVQTESNVESATEEGSEKEENASKNDPIPSQEIEPTISTPDKNTDNTQ